MTLDEIASTEESDRLPKVIAKDEEAQDPHMAKILALTLVAPKPDWITRKSNPTEDKRSHILSIMNPDGQKAEWAFSIAGPTAVLLVPGLQAAKGVFITNANTQVTFDASGSNVGEGAPTYTWRVDDTVAAEGGVKLTRLLTKGTHRVTVEITDSQQRSATASVEVEVK